MALKISLPPIAQTLHGNGSRGAISGLETLTRDMQGHCVENQMGASALNVKDKCTVDREQLLGALSSELREMRGRGLRCLFI